MIEHVMVDRVRIVRERANATASGSPTVAETPVCETPARVCLVAQQERTAGGRREETAAQYKIILPATVDVRPTDRVIRVADGITLKVATVEPGRRTGGTVHHKVAEASRVS